MKWQPMCIVRHLQSGDMHHFTSELKSLPAKWKQGKIDWLQGRRGVGEEREHMNMHVCERTFA